MQIINTVDEIMNLVDLKKSSGSNIGFIPTMGALHLGHLSLIERAKLDCDFIIVSIFVNPTQFNNSKDFEKYPRTLDSDILYLKSVNCDILFLPTVNEMYDNVKLNTIEFNLGYLDTILEGAMRPGHYQGVVTIVEKLLLSIRPDYLYMGLKDYQQVKVVEKLVRDKFIKTNVIGCPTLREVHGLAMSSRNVRLSDKGREDAGEIYRALSFVQNNLCISNPKDIIERAKKEFFNNSNWEIEYLELRNAYDLSEVSDKIWQDDLRYVVLFAGWIEGVRLIDNLEL